MMNRCPVLSTSTDWKVTKDAHVFLSDLPGLKKDEIKVEVNDRRVLQIIDDKCADDDDNDDKNKKMIKWHRSMGSPEKV
ncbi:hypothetical protein AHAS_Ahas10G0175500 [Arachis hypogaea]